VTVPPGDYLASGSCTAEQSYTTGQSTTVPAFGAAQGFLTTDPNFFTAGPFAPGTTESEASVPNMGGTRPGLSGGEFGTANLANRGAFALPKGGTIYEVCRQYEGPLGHGGSDQPISIRQVYVSAIRVDLQTAPPDTGLVQ
jgi:hypothetical protein